MLTVRRKPMRRAHLQACAALGAHLLTGLLGGLAALLLLLCRCTMRRRIVHDPRPQLRLQQRPYIYALLHAHQLAALLVNDETQLAAMVSRSHDGNYLIPLLRARAVRPIRGSSRRGQQDKGGQQALRALGTHLSPSRPALLAVDGPRGPRNSVQRGIVTLAHQCQATILPVAVLSSRHWTLRRSWDQFQIPQPFARLTLIFGAPIPPPAQLDSHSETALRTHLAYALQRLEQSPAQPE